MCVVQCDSYLYYIRTVCIYIHSRLLTVCICPSGLIIGLASCFGLLSVITTVMSASFLTFCLTSFKKRRNEKGVYISTSNVCNYSILCFGLLTESNDVDSDNDVPMTTNPSYMRTTLSTPQSPPTHVV